MKRALKIGLAVSLVALMFCLQRTSAIPYDGRPIARNAAHLYMPGIPFVSQVQLIKTNPNGGVVYESGPTFTTPMAIDCILALVLVALSYFGIARLIDNKLKLSLIQLLTLTLAVAASLVICVSSMDVFWGDNRLKIGEVTMEFTNDQRPKFQRILFGFFLTSAIFGSSSLFIGRLGDSQLADGARLP